MKKWFMAAALILMLSLSAVTQRASALPFLDTVGDGSQVQNKFEVEAIAQLGIFQGNDKQMFEPGKVFTRAEMAKIATLLLTEEEVNSGASMFTDVPESHWARNYINYCAARGILAGKGDGTFGPDDPLTGTASVKIFLCVLGYDAETEGLVGPSWDKNSEKLSRYLNIYAGMDDDFSSSDHLNRDNMAKILCNVLMCPTVTYDSNRVNCIQHNSLLNSRYGYNSIEEIQGELIELEFSERELHLTVGESVGITLTGTYSNGYTHDLTSKNEIISSNSAVASVDGGVVTAREAGRTLLYLGGISSMSSDISMPSPVVVTVAESDRVLKGYRYSVDTHLNMKKGDSLPITVWAVFSDGKEEDLTARVGLSSSNPSAVEIDMDAQSGAASLAAVGLGRSVIYINRAMNSAADDLQIPNAIEITVTSKELNASPEQPSYQYSVNALTMAPGSRAQVTVWAVYPDGFREDVTAACELRSSGEGVASVKMENGNAFIYAGATGTAEISMKNGGASLPVKVISEEEILFSSLKKLSWAVSGVAVDAGTAATLKKGETASLDVYGITAENETVVLTQFYEIQSLVSNVLKVLPSGQVSGVEAGSTFAFIHAGPNMRLALLPPLQFIIL